MNKNPKKGDEVEEEKKNRRSYAERKIEREQSGKSDARESRMKTSVPSRVSVADPKIQEAEQNKARKRRAKDRQGKETRRRNKEDEKKRTYLPIIRKNRQNLTSRTYKAEKGKEIKEIK